MSLLQSCGKGTPKGASEEYFGTAVEDPWRWLENPDTSTTKEWVEMQNNKTAKFLKKIGYRDDIRNRLEQLWNYEKYSAPTKEGGKYYYFKNNGLQNQSVLYVQDELNGEARIVLDPNSFSKDGTASIGGIAFSKNGRYLAYEVSEGGSDWRTIYVKDLENNELLKDTITWTKFSGATWYSDGFFYCRYPVDETGKPLSDKNEFMEVYYHRLGSKQSEDQLIYSDKSHPNYTYGTQVTDDSRYLLLYTSQSTSGNMLHFRNLEAKDNGFTPLVETFGNDYTVIDNIGDKFLVFTNDGAPNYRIVSIDAKNPAKANWKDVIPEGDCVIDGVKIIGGKLVVQYLRNAATEVKVFSQEGKFEYTLQMPEIGAIASLNGKRNDAEAFYSFASFTRPTTIFHLDVKTGQFSVFKQPTLTFKPEEYETKQVFYKSADGTNVPMFITAKKGILLDGSHPTLLYGYGGFNISVTPAFKPQMIALLEKGGIYAVANIRGGGEFGETWHKAGTKMNKKNVFNDFIAAAEYLISQKYTSTEKLAIEGRSNGGLLVGACITMRPDLFGVAFPGVGVMDMLRYHTFTIGYLWADDYGRSDESKEMFEYLYSYSPVHNCKPAKYPATLITTADHDDRVVPAHSFKFAAALQPAQQGDKPILIRIDTKAGHGAGKPTSMVIEEEADKLAFLFYNTNSPF